MERALLQSGLHWGPNRSVSVGLQPYDPGDDLPGRAQLKNTFLLHTVRLPGFVRRRPGETFLAPKVCDGSDDDDDETQGRDALSCLHFYSSL